MVYVWCYSIGYVINRQKQRKGFVGFTSLYKHIRHPARGCSHSNVSSSACWSYSQSVRLVTIAHWVPSLFCDTVLLKGRLKEERLTVPSYSYMLEGSHSGGSLRELVT